MLSTYPPLNGKGLSKPFIYIHICNSSMNWSNFRSVIFCTLSSNPDPTVRMTFWTATLGYFPGIVNAAYSQLHMQRYIALPTLRHAQGYVYNNIIFVLLLL